MRMFEAKLTLLYAALLIVLVLLVGCTSTSDPNALCLSYSCEQSRAEARKAKAEAQDRAACIEYGFKEGTPGFAECRLRLAEMRSADRAAKKAALLGIWQQQQQQYQQKPAPIPPIKTPTQTNCQDMGGGVIHCTTY